MNDFPLRAESAEPGAPSHTRLPRDGILLLATTLARRIGHRLISPPLRRICDTTDLSQSVARRILETRHVLEHMDVPAIRAWVRKVVVGLVATRARRLRGPRQAAIMAPVSESASPASTTSPVAEAIRLETRRVAREALGRMSERERETLLLRVAEDLPHRALADVQGLPSEAAARQACARARAQFFRHYLGRSAPPAAERDRIGPYRIGREIGRGATGRVCVAEVVSEAGPCPGGTQVAVKLLRDGLLDHRRGVERFRREVEAAMAVRHGSLVRAYDAGVAMFNGRETAWIVMEWLSGISLRERLKSRRTASRGELLQIGSQVADGLAHVHSLGFVHRDVKPENILLTASGVRLLDLGLAFTMDGRLEALTSTGAFVGTLRYAAPEQLERSRVGPPADVYSLGMTLWEAAAGHHPFPTRDAVELGRRIRERAVPPLVSAAPGIDPDISAWVDRMLAGDPAARPPAVEVVAGLGNLST